MFSLGCIHTSYVLGCTGKFVHDHVDSSLFCYTSWLRLKRFGRARAERFPSGLPHCTMHILLLLLNVFLTVYIKKSFLLSPSRKAQVMLALSLGAIEMMLWDIYDLLEHLRAWYPANRKDLTLEPSTL